jgi:aspartate/glutamate racemase
VILGGTELPLILKQSDFEDIKIFNTTEIHVREYCPK